jgi:hypothetical protein
MTWRWRQRAPREQKGDAARQFRVEIRELQRALRAANMARVNTGGLQSKIVP